MATSERPSTELAELKAKLVDAVQILDVMGVWEGNSGHVSSRIPGTRQICMLGHLHEAGRGIPIADVTEEHLIVLDLDTYRWEGRLEPPGEFYIHTAVYKARPDVGAVIHCHPEFPVVLSVADIPVIPAHHRGSYLAPHVPIFDDHRQVEDEAIAGAMVEALGDGFAVVLRAHGATIVGATIEEAVAVTHTLDACARRQYMAAAVGTPRPIRVDAGARRRPSPASVMNHWHLHLALAERGRARREGGRP